MARFVRNKKGRIPYISKCCKSSFETKHNGMWNYYVCDNCHGKAELIKPDMRFKENKLKYGKKIKKNG